MTASPPPGHLSDERLAGYIDGTLPPADRSAVETHLADCSICRAEILAASRAVESAPSAGRPVRLGAIGVAAAAAVLVIAIALRQNGAASDDADRVRSQSPDGVDNAVTVVAPVAGAAIPASGIRFVWQRVPRIVEYTITVQDADGQTRWSTSTTDTTVLLPDSVAIANGSVLHWYVDGLRADGRPVGSGRQQVMVR